MEKTQNSSKFFSMKSRIEPAPMVSNNFQTVLNGKQNGASPI